MKNQLYNIGTGWTKAAERTTSGVKDFVGNFLLPILVLVGIVGIVLQIFNLRSARRDGNTAAFDSAVENLVIAIVLTLAVGSAMIWMWDIF